MRIIAPIMITEGAVTTNVADNAEPVWDSTTTYAEGNEVQHDLYLYESLIADNTGNNPAETNNEVSAEPAWLKLGAVNKWEMFDGMLGSYTERDEEIVVSIEFSRSLDSIALLGMAGQEVVIAVENTSGSITESITKDLTEDPLIDWGEYFFKPLVEPRSDYTTKFQNLYLTGTVTVTIKNPDDTAKCGLLLLGRGEYIGAAQYGINSGIMDFSKKERDDFGRTFLKQGAYAKLLNVDLFVPNPVYDRTSRTLSAYRGKAIVWDANANTTDYTSFVVYGFFIDFRMRLNGPSMSECVLEIEGLEGE